mgnify:CR=1 FL=1
MVKYTPALKKDHKNYAYDKRMQQMMHILADKKYWGSSRSLSEKGHSYKKFVSDMISAIVRKRDITKKMDNAMKNIVTRYMESTDPKKIKEKEKRIERIHGKIQEVRSKVNKANYSESFRSSGYHFLASIMSQVEKTGKLSPKQKDALNKMYVKANKRIQKNG